jgi:hypothetical protein
MTDRQITLIRAEIQRHVKLATASYEPEIHRGHMEVAAALSAAIESEEKLCDKSMPRRLWRWAIRTVSARRHSPAKSPVEGARWWCGSRAK